MTTILIVEDQWDNRKILRDLVTHHGYEVLETSDGVECLKLARQFRPALILMDIQLPEISGLEVVKWLREDDDLKDTPVIAITAFAMRGDEEKIIKGGCDIYIAKPFEPRHVISEIKRLIRCSRRKSDE